MHTTPLPDPLLRRICRSSNRWCFLLLSLVLALLLVLPPVVPAHAAGYSCDEAGLDAAIAAGGEATIACSVPTTIVTSATKVISTAVNLDGGGNLTLSGANTHRVFAVSSGVSFGLHNLTITQGATRGYPPDVSIDVSNGGAGLINTGGTLTINNTTFLSNTADYGGGGLASYGGSVVISDSTFVWNRAIVGGGGGAAIGADTIVIVNTRFVGNTGCDGGGLSLSSVSGALFSGVLLDRNLAPGDSGTKCPGIGGGMNSYGPVTIQDSTFSNNSAVQGGGGIYHQGPLTITRSSFLTNTAWVGGGIEVLGQPAVITNSRLAGNVALNNTGYWTGGGGIATGGVVTITQSSITNNGSYAWGGGIANRGVLTLINSTVTGNIAHLGGGIANGPISGDWLGDLMRLSPYVGQLQILSSTISSNGNPSVGEGVGGGIGNAGGSVRIAASTITGNMASESGGGIASQSLGDPAWGPVFPASLSLVNSTLSGNTAGATGAALVVSQTAGIRSQAAITNSTIAENQTGQGGSVAVISGTLALRNTLLDGPAPNCSGSINSQGYNFSSDGSCQFSAYGDRSFTPLMLGPLQDNGGPTWTQALLPGSPAINHGGMAGCPATDQRGVVRPQGGLCDSGSYEASSATPGSAAFLPVGQRGVGMGW